MTRHQPGRAARQLSESRHCHGAARAAAAASGGARPGEAKWTNFKLKVRV